MGGVWTRMGDKIGMMKELRDSGVKEEFAHVTAVAGRALARQGLKDRGKRYDNVPNVEMRSRSPANVLGVLG